MPRDVYDKWEEVKEHQKENGIYIVQVVVGNKGLAKFYLGTKNDKFYIYINFPKEMLEDIKLPSLKGMNFIIDKVDEIQTGEEYLIVENVSENEIIFESFSSSLVDELFGLTNYHDIFDAVLKTIKEYKDYFANPNKALSKQEEQGLCAELLELSKLILLKGDNVVFNWQGPSKNKRDFVFNNLALEIKSTLKQENTSIFISNENQLDNSYPSNLEKLFLKVYIMEDSDDGINVTKCIENVLNTIKTINARKVFLANLLKLKIDGNSYQSKYQFSVQRENVYLIDDIFPKITSKNVSNGIHSISYLLNIDNIKDFIIEENEIYGLL